MAAAGIGHAGALQHGRVEVVVVEQVGANLGIGQEPQVTAGTGMYLHRDHLQGGP